MAKLFEIDISALGTNVLIAAFKKLPERSQKAVFKGAVRPSAYRIRLAIARSIAALGLVKTGTMLKLYRKAPVRARPRSRTSIGVDIQDPTREKLGIAAYVKGETTGYYPHALEYGSKKVWRGHPKGAKAYRFIRGTVEVQAFSERRKIAKDIGRIVKLNFVNLTAGITKGLIVK